ncbi:MAG: hypothetical protein J6V99_06800 [Neisseriaceae bacterium]|nr:hypothetical protein [Neisseriaceae bacterium]
MVKIREKIETIIAFVALLLFISIATFILYHNYIAFFTEKMSKDGYDKLIETQGIIRNISHNLNTNDFRVGIIKLDAVHSWSYIKSYIYLDECMDSNHINNALVNNGFKDIRISMNSDKFTANACIGDVHFDIDSKPQNGKLCGKLNIEYSWEKNRNLNNPKCWDTPKQSSKDNEQ